MSTPVDIALFIVVMLLLGLLLVACMKYADLRIHADGLERCLEITDGTLLERVRTINVLQQDLDTNRRDRDDALTCLELVLKDDDVAATLDMYPLFRDNAPILRERLGVVTAIETATKRVPGEPR